MSSRMWEQSQNIEDANDGAPETLTPKQLLERARDTLRNAATIRQAEPALKDINEALRLLPPNP